MSGKMSGEVVDFRKARYATYEFERASSHSVDVHGNEFWMSSAHDYLEMNCIYEQAIFCNAVNVGASDVGVRAYLSFYHVKTSETVAATEVPSDGNRCRMNYDETSNTYLVYVPVGRSPVFAFNSGTVPFKKIKRLESSYSAMSSFSKPVSFVGIVEAEYRFSTSESPTMYKNILTGEVREGNANEALPGYSGPEVSQNFLAIGNIHYQRFLDGIPSEDRSIVKQFRVVPEDSSEAMDSQDAKELTEEKSQTVLPTHRFALTFFPVKDSSVSFTAQKEDSDSDYSDSEADDPFVGGAAPRSTVKGNGAALATGHVLKQGISLGKPDTATSCLTTCASRFFIRFVIDPTWEAGGAGAGAGAGGAGARGPVAGGGVGAASDKDSITKAVIDACRAYTESVSGARVFFGLAAPVGALISALDSDIRVPVDIAKAINGLDISGPHQSRKTLISSLKNYLNSNKDVYGLCDEKTRGVFGLGSTVEPS